MGYLSEKYNYVKGLCDGLGANETETKEGKILAAVMELLDEMVLSVEDLEESRDEMNEMLDEIDEDLADLEDEFYEDEDDEDDDETDEFECPECNSLIKLTENILSDDGESIICPVCGEEIEIEWDDDCDCDECRGDDEDK